jgi:hypothetical protein
MIAAIVIVVVGILTLAIVLWSNVSYAQILKGLVPNILYSPHKSHTPHKSYAITITSPTKGQQVPVGKNLTIQGTSIANAASNCKVYVIVNGLKPYQQATGTGPGGKTDYMRWSFVLNSKYTTIKQGSNNKITAKYTCSNNTMRSFYSVNVTGISQHL